MQLHERGAEHSSLVPQVHLYCGEEFEKRNQIQAWMQKVLVGRVADFWRWRNHRISRRKSNQSSSHPTTYRVWGPVDKIQDCLSGSREKQVSVYQTVGALRISLDVQSPLMDSSNSVPESIFVVVGAHSAYMQGKPRRMESWCFWKQF